MAVVWETIKPGDILYEVKSVAMGNTRIRRRTAYSVVIDQIDHEKGVAVVIWNGNRHRPRVWYRHKISKLYRNPPKGTD